MQSSEIGMSRTRDLSAEGAADKLAMEQAHKAMMERLDRDLRDMLKQNKAPRKLLESRQRARRMVERALQKDFSSAVTVQSVGLDCIGLSLVDAPLELVIVDPNYNASGLPRPDNRLYHPPALIQTLRNSGISTKLFTPPNWISPESMERPFALPYAALINPALQLVLLPPSPEHASRLALLESYIRRHSSMRDLIGVLYILAMTGSDIVSPPLTSQIISHLIMSYYTKAAQTAAVMTSPNGSSLFYSQPATAILPDGSFDASPCTEHVVATPGPAPEVIPNRKRTSLAYDLLEMLRWWDQLRWDQDIIVPTSPIPLLRSFDAKSNIDGVWDWRHSPLLLQDTVNPLNNLATLLTRPHYAELRRSFRCLHRNLQSGLRLSIARNLTRPLHVGPEVMSSAPNQTQSFSTAPISDYGAHLTEEMTHYYQQSRPTKVMQLARRKTMNRLANIIQKWYGPSYEPVLFGSSRYGVSDSESDLDIMILDKTRPHGYAPQSNAPLPQIYQLHRLAGTLKATGFVKIVTIAGARVPIIKVTDPDTGLNIDININNRLGLHNTEMLQHYCTLWPPLSNLIYVVKKWAKYRGLNDPSGRNGPSFSSYCLTLMIVGFLQSHGVLPNLQDPRHVAQGNPIHSSIIDERNICKLWVWVKDTKTTRVKCSVDWYRLPVQEWAPAVDPPLGQAFYAWLSYFAYDHKYDEFAVRIAEGGVVPRRTKKKPVKPSFKQAKSMKKKSSDKEADVQEVERVEEAGDGIGEDDTAPIEAVVTAEALTEDVGKEKLQAIAAGPRRDAPSIEESLEEHLIVRNSQLDEPERWCNNTFVVGDPFIYEKNCAGNVSKNTVNEFVASCQDSLRLIDGGATLITLLSRTSLRKDIQKQRREKRQKKMESRKERGKGKRQLESAAPVKAETPLSAPQDAPDAYPGPKSVGDKFQEANE